LSAQRSSSSATIPASSSKLGWRTTLDALSVRNYRIYWSGTVASYFAGQMQIPTQSWLAYELTSSPLLLGLTMAMQGIPQLLISPISGVIIDRIQKRNIIILTQAFTIAIMLAIAILITTGHIQYWHLLVSSFLNGFNQAFNMPARNSIVPELVPKDKIYNAFALNNGGANVARIAGPALAGVLIGLVGTQGAYYVGVGFNVLAIATISLLPPTSKLGLISGKSITTNFKEGFRYLRLHNILLVLLGMEIILTFFGMSYQGLMPVFAELLKVKSEGYGFMMAAVGIGSLIGSLGIASLGNFKRKGMVLLSAGIVFGIFLLLFGNAGYIGTYLNIGIHAYYLAAFFLIIVGISSTSYTATSLTIFQMNISDEFRGRMTSIYQTVIALYPFSILLSSAVAEFIGAPLTLTIGGTGLAISMLLIFCFGQRVRKLE